MTASEETNGQLPDEDLSAIQGGILRGYRVKSAHHFIVSFQHARGAGQLMQEMSATSPLDVTSPLRVSTALKWEVRPATCLNIGLTAAGLSKLGLPDSLMRLFPGTFRRGPAHRAATLGDDSASAPENWVFGGPEADPVHAVVSLYTIRSKEGDRDADPDARFALRSRQLREQLAQCEVSILHEVSASALPEDREHFGFRDGISQPNVEGDGGRRVRDLQPSAKTGEFLLGRDYVNQFGGNFIGDLPRELADNATYGAFRMMAQDVFQFRRFILDVKNANGGLDEELIAAKLMGRWRDGMPLSLAPTNHLSAREKLPEELNEFDYSFSEYAPAHFDDFDGLRCPVNAHIRRMNPRGALVMGKPYTRRLIRRNVPYGPPAPPGVTDDGYERGLVGFFFCGDLESQFEFLLKTWANKDIHTAGTRDIKDPLIGAHPPSGGRFVIRTNDERDPIVIQQMPRFVRTRGSVYCFVPAITGLQFLSRLAC